MTANDLSIADDPAFSRTAFVQAKSLGIGVEVWPLIASRQLRVTGLTIEQPAIALLQAPNGDWNFSKLGGDKSTAKVKAPAPEGAAKAPMDISVKQVKITGGRFSVGKTGGRSKPLVLQDVSLEVRDFSAGSAFPFTFATKVAGGGEIKVEGKAGPIDAVDVAASPLTATLRVEGLDLAGTGLTQNAPAIAGRMGLQAAMESDGTRAHVKGKLKADRLRLARDGTPATRPVEFDFTLDHNLRRHSGQLKQGGIRIGSAPASLTGSYGEEGESTTLKMNLDGPRMAVGELEGMLPAMGIVLPRGSSLEGGTVSVKLALQGRVEQLVTTGAIALENTKLAHFDIGKKMEAIQRLAGIKGAPDTEIQTLGANLRIGPEGAALENIQLIVPAIGSLEGGGTSTAAHVLDFKMRATVHAAGGTPIPFMVQGPASDPVFRPDMRALAKEELNKFTGGDAMGKATGLIRGLFGEKKK